MQTRSPELYQQIITAARESFYEQGYKETSLTTIAKKAHTAVSNLYTYFQNKEELFNCVIGDVPDLIDSYVIMYYEEVIAKIKKSKENIKITDIFLETFKVTPEVSMTFSILINGSEGTKYEEYKNSLMMILKYYVVRNMEEYENIALSEMLSHMFFVQMLSGLYVNKLIERKKDEDLDIATVSLDKENKKVFVRVYRWIPEDERVFYRYKEQFESVVRNVDTREYRLEVDVREIQNIAMDIIVKKAAELYYECHFKKVDCIFNPRQIAFVVHTKREFQKAGIGDMGIIIKE